MYIENGFDFFVSRKKKCVSSSLGAIVYIYSGVWDEIVCEFLNSDGIVCVWDTSCL